LGATVELKIVGIEDFTTANGDVPYCSQGSSRPGEISFWGNFTTSVCQKAELASPGFPNRGNYIPISIKISN
jgi:hypothetical protein